MKLETRIVTAGTFAGACCILIALMVQRHIIREQGIELTKNTMRAILINAENVRESTAQLNQQKAFDTQKLVDEYKKTKDLHNSSIYSTIPVVAAWKTVRKVAGKENLEFRIPKHRPRNPENSPTPDEEVILQSLESGGTAEYFKVDSTHHQLVYARPILLTTDCLSCHGDPKNSPTGDGKDLAGGDMENWKAGEVHGAFVLKSSLLPIEAMVKAGVIGTMVWLLPLSVVIVVAFYFFNRKYIVRPLCQTMNFIDSASIQTAAAASEVCAASQSLAEGASEQASALEETSASLEEMSSMTRRSSEYSQKAKEATGAARMTAEKGTEFTREIVESMKGIQTASDEMRLTMDGIRNSSMDVAKIVKTIDEIAFQTNILALNAAVEAARAGEAGMGFAVVADEVRSLAQRSASAARETAERIQASYKRSEDGVVANEKVNSSIQEISQNVGQLSTKLAEILSSVREVDEMVGHIATASNEQSLGISQITNAVEQIDKVTQHNASSAEESAAASEQLSAQAAVLKESVHGLSTLVGQSSDSLQEKEPQSQVGHAANLNSGTSSHSDFGASLSRNAGGNKDFKSRNNSTLDSSFHDKN